MKAILKETIHDLSVKAHVKENIKFTKKFFNLWYSRVVYNRYLVNCTVNIAY